MMMHRPDPTAAIRSLRSAAPYIRMYKGKTFVVKAGGGVFADAQDQSGLSAAIAETLRAPFRVYDEAGAVVGEGIVGSDAIPVPMGTYRVEVLADPEPVVFDGVRVGTGETVHLEVGGQEP